MVQVQVMELDGTQVMEIAKKVLIKCSNLEKKKEKNKMGSRQRYI